MNNTEMAMVKLLATYKANPMALCKAVAAYVDGEVDKRVKGLEKDIATRTCVKLHTSGSDSVVCRGCFDALQEDTSPLKTGDI